MYLLSLELVEAVAVLHEARGREGRGRHAADAVQRAEVGGGGARLEAHAHGPHVDGVEVRLARLVRADVAVPVVPAHTQFTEASFSDEMSIETPHS